MEAATAQAQGIPPGFGAVAPSPSQAQQSGGQVEITLGDTTVPVYAQRHAYLANRLGRTFQGFVASGDELNTENFLGFLGGQVYEVLSALVPSLPSRMPKHAFNGYASEEKMEAGEYDPEHDKSPTFPEIVTAFECVWRVNRFDVLGKLGTIVDPRVLRANLSLWMSEQLSTTLRSSQQPSGASAPTPSGLTDPTSPPNAD